MEPVRPGVTPEALAQVAQAVDGFNRLGSIQRLSVDETSVLLTDFSGERFTNTTYTTSGGTVIPVLEISNPEDPTGTTRVIRLEGLQASIEAAQEVAVNSSAVNAALENLNGIRVVAIQPGSVTLADSLPGNLTPGTFQTPGGATINTVKLDVSTLGQVAVVRADALATVIEEARAVATGAMDSDAALIPVASAAALTGKPAGSYRTEDTQRRVVWDGQQQTYSGPIAATAADLTSRPTLPALAQGDVVLGADVTWGEVVLPTGRQLAGGVTLTTAGVVVPSRSNVEGLNIVGNDANRSALIVPGNSKARPLRDLTVSQPGTGSAAVLVQEGGAAVLEHLVTHGGAFGVNVTIAARAALHNVRTEDAGTGILIWADGAGKSMRASSVIGGATLRAKLHGIQIWGGDAASDPEMRQRGAVVIGHQVQDAIDGAGIWATNTTGGVFVGNTVDAVGLEGVDVEHVDTFAISANTLVDVPAAAVTLLYGSRNVAVTGNATALRHNRNLSGAFGSANEVAGLTHYIRDDSEHILISGEIADATIRNEAGVIQNLMGKFVLWRNGSEKGPRSVTIVGCRFRNVAFDFGEYCERIEFIDSVLEYDFDFTGTRPVKIERCDKILLDNLTVRLLGTPIARSGANNAPVFITQNAQASAAGAPMVTDICVRGVRVLGWGDNAGLTVTTWRGGAGPADNSRLVLTDNAVSNIYVSATNPTRRVSGNYHPDTLADVAVTLV